MSTSETRLGVCVYVDVLPLVFFHIMSASLVAYEDSSESESEENPEQGAGRRPAASKEDVRQLLSVLPPAKRRGGAKQPVRIGLPTLENEVGTVQCKFTWPEVGIKWRQAIYTHFSRRTPRTTRMTRGKELQPQREQSL